MTTHAVGAAVLVALCSIFGCAPMAKDAPADHTRPAHQPGAARMEGPMVVHYLEIVTPEVDATCRVLETMHGVRFSEPVAALGNARTILLPDGRRIGVRAPMHGGEKPVVRPYLLVKDIHAAVEAARAAGAEIAHPPLEIPGMGSFAIYFLGGIEHGLWER